MLKPDQGTAYEDMMVHGAPNRHVVDYEYHQRSERSRKAVLAIMRRR